LDKALALAKRAVKFKPIPSYWDTLSYSLYKKQKYEEADKAIKKALELQPDHPEYLTRQRAIQQRLLK
jgi:tetratricopeptide (TPR) repeat protein